ncbi:cyclic nucleotide-binding domain-containing protein [Caldifermentibacillus hisashii]|uniref:cyclic nucleotide-binding domain-containing protein n=1 Tax=Caldifermentibacillus hisashii TaxID=996558 RepID=UPI0031B71342
MQTLSNKRERLSDELRQLLKSIGTVRSIHEDSYLFHQGMDAKEMYLIKSGLIQISMLSSEGEEMVLRICRTDDIVGELTLFCDDPKYLLNAKVDLALWMAFATGHQIKCKTPSSNQGVFLFIWKNCFANPMA